MKTSVNINAILLMFLVVFVTPAFSETQELDGYTIFGGSLGPQVCLGKWTPSKDPVMPGVCEGQVLGISQLTAISSRLSADRLDKLLVTLSSIDQKMTVNNDQMLQLIKTGLETQRSIEGHVALVNELLRDAIDRRFDEIPEKLLENDLFREELEKLKADILKEVGKHYSRKPEQPVK